VPLDRLILETDSPFLAPVPMRGKRNEPANLAHTARFLAELRGESLEDLEHATTTNAETLFRI
jgi:TatD DNase family protein